MLVYPCCKINLGLNIVERRPDGYHNLETVFYPIPLHDNLEVIEMENIAQPYVLHQTGTPLDGEAEHNLVVRVYELLRQDYAQLPPIEIWLHKRIPSGAGLGGGSSDAAFMMKLLNEQFELDMTDEDMEYRLSRLGADCPFFFRAKPAFATGIGDELMPIDLDLGGLNLLLIKPNVHVSTKEAYALVKPHPTEKSLLLALSQPIASWRDTIKNDFEPSVFARYPQIASIKATLYDMGALYASMSGSGSSVFALFDRTIAEAEEVFRDCFIYQTRLPSP